MVYTGFGSLLSFGRLLGVSEHILHEQGGTTVSIKR